MLNFKQFKARQSEIIQNSKPVNVNEAEASIGGGIIDAILMAIFGLFNSIGSGITNGANYAALQASKQAYLDQYELAGSGNSKTVYFRENIQEKEKEIDATIEKLEAGKEVAKENASKAREALVGQNDDAAANKRTAIQKKLEMTEKKIDEEKANLKASKNKLKEAATIKWEGESTEWESMDEEMKEKLDELEGRWKEKAEKELIQSKREIDLVLKTKMAKYTEGTEGAEESAEAAANAKEALDRINLEVEELNKDWEGSTEAETAEAIKYAPSLAKLSPAQAKLNVLLTELKAKYTDAYNSAQPSEPTAPGTGGSASNENYSFGYNKPEINSIFNNLQENLALRQTGPAGPLLPEAVKDSLIEYSRSGFTAILEADGTATNGTATNGTATNGTATNGTATNGTATNGTATNGTATNGTATNGTATNGTATNGTATNGTATNGTATNGTATNGTATNGTATNGTATNGTEDTETKKKTLEVTEKINPTEIFNLMSKAYEVQPDEKKKDFAKEIVQDIENVKSASIEFSNINLETANEVEKNADKMPSSIKSTFLEEDKVKESIKNLAEKSKDLYKEQLEDFGKKSEGQPAASESAKPDFSKSRNIVTYNDYVKQRDKVKSTNESISVKNPEFITLDRYIAEIKPNLD